MPYGALVEVVKMWRGIRSEGIEKDLHRRAAIELVMEAVLATKAYLYDRELGDASRATERLLSSKWQKAAYAIEEYDRELFFSARLKSLGWADPREWSRAEGREYAIALNTLLEHCDYIKGRSREDNF
ncbi:hypothetical protein [Pseudomonas sp. DWRC2-2]|uniref:hypothetical protein n=1 Tax=Pseudomonas sp. DWRC2-2 TaxID=2804567 RepID=UPI003CFB72EC